MNTDRGDHKLKDGHFVLNPFRFMIWRLKGDGVEDVQNLICGRFRILRRVDTYDPVQRSIGQDVENRQLMEIWSSPMQLTNDLEIARIEQIASICAQNMVTRGTIQIPTVSTCRHGDQVHLVFPFVEGEFLTQRLNSGPLSETESLRAALDVLDVLKDLHNSGRVHGDIRPSRVIESQSTRRFTLLPGLPEGLHSLLLAGQGSTRGQIECAQYLSPELVRPTSIGPTVQSDLFSLGALLFECLVGEPLFTGLTLADIYLHHLSIPHFSSRLPSEASDSLIRILDHLLELDPKQRYQSAEGAYADIATLYQALESKTKLDLVVGTSDLRTTLTEPGFVNRVAELDLFQSALAQASSGSGRLLIVEATSGSGKTRLLEEFALQSRRMGRLVLQGGAEIETARRPFQVFSGLAESLIEADRNDPGLGKRLREYIGYHSATLRRVLPALQAILPESPEEAIEAREELEQFARTRILTAFAELLNGLGSRDRPAIVLIDDFQWADPLAIDLLSFWQNRSSNLPHPLVSKGEQFVLIAIAFRTEEVPKDHPLRRLQPESLTLNLDPLTAPQIRSLTLSMAGRALPPEIIERVQKISAGNPFTAHAYLHGLLESGFLVSAPDTWRIESEASDIVAASTEAATFLADRFQFLAPETLELMSYAAVLGKRFDLDLLGRLLSLSEEEVRRSLDEAVLRRMVLIEKNHGVFFHDKIRETVLQRISAQDRQVLHEKAADLLVADGGTDPFAIAYHYDRAQLATKAAPFAAVAAQIARSQYNLLVAEENLRIALKGRSAGEEANQPHLYKELGEVLSLEGKYAEAHTFFNQAIARTQNPTDRALLHGLVAETFLRQGNVAIATSILGNTLGTLGCDVPETDLGLRINIAWEQMIYTLHQAFPWLFVERRSLENGAKDLLTVDLLHKFAYAHVFKETQTAVWAVYRSMNLSERYPVTTARANAYAYYGYALTLFHRFQRFARPLYRAIEIHQQIRNPVGEAADRATAAAAFYAASRPEEALLNSRAAMKLFERTGNRHRYNDVHLVIAFVHLRRGQMKSAIEVSRIIYEDGLRIGDTHATGMAVGIWAKATGGNVPTPILERELQSAPDDIFTQSEVRQAQALVLMRQGEYEKAADCLEEARAQFESGHLDIEYAIPTYFYLSEAYRHLARQTRTWESDRRSEYLKLALKRARNGLGHAHAYRNNLPHAYRELGLLAAAQGKFAKSLHFLNKSLKAADELGAAAESAHSLWFRGQIGSHQNWGNSEADIRFALDELRRLDALFLIERERALPEFQTGDPAHERVEVLMALNPLLIAPTITDAIEAARRAVKTLIAADSVRVLSPAPAGRESETLKDQYDSSVNPINIDLLQRVVALRQIQTLSISSANPENTPALQLHVGTPLMINGEPAAILYTILSGTEMERQNLIVRTLEFVARMTEEKLADLLQEQEEATPPPLAQITWRPLHH